MSGLAFSLTGEASVPVFEEGDECAPHFGELALLALDRGELLRGQSPHAAARRFTAPPFLQDARELRDSKADG